MGRFRSRLTAELQQVCEELDVPAVFLEEGERRVTTPPAAP